MRRLCFAVSALIVALDQALKYIAGLWFADGIDLFPNVLYLTYTRNDGASLGMLSGQTWLLVGVSAVASIVMIFCIMGRIYRLTTGERFAVAAVLGGAVGNLIDRAVPPHSVVDMLYFPWIGKIPLLPDFVCNFADIAVTFGVAAFLVLYAKRELTKSKHNAEKGSE